METSNQMITQEIFANAIHESAHYENKELIAIKLHKFDLRGSLDNDLITCKLQTMTTSETHVRPLQSPLSQVDHASHACTAHVSKFAQHDMFHWPMFHNIKWNMHGVWPALIPAGAPKPRAPLQV